MRRILGLLIVLALAAAFLAPKLFSTAGAGRGAVPAENSEVPRVLKVTVERMVPEELVERLSTTGTVRANEQVEIVSEVAGKVERILFEEGVISQDDYDLALNQLNSPRPSVGASAVSPARAGGSDRP